MRVGDLTWGSLWSTSFGSSGVWSTSGAFHPGGVCHRDILWGRDPWCSSRLIISRVYSGHWASSQVFPGKDGLIRTVEVKTSSGKLVRSVQRVHDLEIMNNGFGDTLTTCASPVNRSDNVSSDTAEMTENRVEIEPEREVYRTQFGHPVKPVVRFDIIIILVNDMIILSTSSYIWCCHLTWVHGYYRYGLTYNSLDWWPCLW